jgi:hypothetical protein
MARNLKNFLGVTGDGADLNVRASDSHWSW